jgi:hypothetical protein
LSIWNRTIAYAKVRVLVDAKGRRQDDEEQDEGNRSQDRADKNVKCLPALAGILQREGRVSQGHQSHHQVVA